MTKDENRSGNYHPKCRAVNCGKRHRKDYHKRRGERIEKALNGNKYVVKKNQSSLSAYPSSELMDDGKRKVNGKFTFQQRWVKSNENPKIELDDGIKAARVVAVLVLLVAIALIIII